MTIQLTASAALRGAAEPILDQLVTDQVASRLFAQDAALWGIEAAPEAAKRLGWVDPFAASLAVLAEAEQLRDELRNRQVDRIVLCGMGGSSLGPEVMARAAGVPLTVVDSTHPDVVRRALQGDLARTAVVISSKSGGTLETRTHAELFRNAFLTANLDPAAHMIYVTDPDSPLSELRAEGYRVFLADPNVGGRFSVLTAFGIVPTVLAGANVAAVLAAAQAVRDLLRSDSADNPGLRLAASLAAGLPTRYVLLLSEAPEVRWGLGDWIEQLVAESTGKAGKGVLPIALPADAPEFAQLPQSALGVCLGGTASLSHELGIDAPLGAQFLLWEVATAALGRLLGINPFDQPDVESAKVAAHQELGAASETVATVASLVNADVPALVQQIRAALPSNGYLAIQAFVDRDSTQGDLARDLRDRLATELGVPVALGWGPRYLHSTGQLHKGGPALGVFLQLVDTTAAELPIPGSTNGIAELLRAQARGDRAVLEARDRTVFSCAV